MSFKNLRKTGKQIEAAKKNLEKAREFHKRYNFQVQKQVSKMKEGGDRSLGHYRPHKMSDKGLESISGLSRNDQIKYHDFRAAGENHKDALNRLFGKYL